jgi:hypothetical protein
MTLEERIATFYNCTWSKTDELCPVTDLKPCTPECPFIDNQCKVRYNDQQSNKKTLKNFTNIILVERFKYFKEKK